MSEEAEAIEPEESEEAPEEAPQEDAEDEQESAPAGTKAVEMDQETQARFNRIYGNMKQYERVVDKMGKENKMLIDRINELETKFVDKDVKDEITSLKEQKREALEMGEIDRVLEIDDQILEARLKAQKEPPPKEEPDPQVIADEWMTPERKTALESWAIETDEGGQFRRPWANPAHPDHPKAVKVAQAVVEDPNFDGDDITAILAEVDRKMGSFDKPKRTTPTVIGDSSGAPRRGQRDVKLTEDQKLVARKMGMSEKQYVEAMKKLGA